MTGFKLETTVYDDRLEVFDLLRGNDLLRRCREMNQRVGIVEVEAVLPDVGKVIF